MGRPAAPAWRSLLVVSWRPSAADRCVDRRGLTRAGTRQNDGLMRLLHQGMTVSQQDKELFLQYSACGLFAADTVRLTKEPDCLKAGNIRVFIRRGEKSCKRHAQRVDGTTEAYRKQTMGGCRVAARKGGCGSRQNAVRRCLRASCVKWSGKMKACSAASRPMAGKTIRRSGRRWDRASRRTACATARLRSRRRAAESMPDG